MRLPSTLDTVSNMALQEPVESALQSLRSSQVRLRSNTYAKNGPHLASRSGADYPGLIMSERVRRRCVIFQATSEAVY